MRIPPSVVIDQVFTIDGAAVGRIADALRGLRHELSGHADFRSGVAGCAAHDTG